MSVVQVTGISAARGSTVETPAGAATVRNYPTIAQIEYRDWREIKGVQPQGEKTFLPCRDEECRVCMAIERPILFEDFLHIPRSVAEYREAIPVALACPEPQGQ